MALAKDRETLDFDVHSELRSTPKVHRRVRNSSISRSVPVGGKINRCAPGSRLRSFGKRKTRASRSIPLGTGLWFDFSSGEWIRTTDLRVMREEPGFGTVDLLTRRFSELIVLRFRRPLQTTVVDQRSYSKSFCGGSQALFCHFSTFFEWIQPLKPPLTRCRGST